MLISLLLHLCLDWAQPHPGASPPLGTAAATLDLTQLNLDLDDGVTMDSAWGKAILRHTGFPIIRYFNLSIDGRWEIRNIAILSENGLGAANTNNLFFDLAVPPGRNVTSVTVGVAITDAPLFGPPPPQGPMPVLDELFKQRSGEWGGEIGSTPAKGQAGGQVVGVAETHKNFPNGECGGDECVPNAVSNSLKYLKREFGLTVPDSAISLETMRGHTGYQQGQGCPDYWPARKEEYLNSPTFDGNRIWQKRIIFPGAEDIEGLAEKLKRKHDIELSFKAFGRPVGHVVALVGIVKLENGNYQLSYVQDSAQGTPGGTEGVCTLVVRPNGYVEQGGPSIPEGCSLDGIVDEWVAFPKSPATPPAIDR